MHTLINGKCYIGGVPCPYQQDIEVDALFRMLSDANHVILFDRDGIVLRISDLYAANYGMPKEELIGSSVYELERRGIFVPSVTIRVLQEKRKISIMQTLLRGNSVLATGMPIFDDAGEIKYVVSFNTLDIGGNLTPQQCYDKLKELITHYESATSANQQQLQQQLSYIGNSVRMRHVNETLMQIADTGASVIITGETGVGKSMIANVLHKCSARARGPFVEINCGAIPESLIEAELFGYVGGAFTGASRKGHMGKIEAANGGTLFLDEIGELPYSMQNRFLQVLQEKAITRVGSTQPVELDFRLVVATNRDLSEDVASGRFREDLFYRIDVIPIHIPPLRERSEDIIPLIMSFLNTFNTQHRKNVRFSKESLLLLERQEWPGNVRQLKNTIERIVLLAKNSTLAPHQLPIALDAQDAGCSMGLDAALESAERRLIEEAYAKHRTSVAVAKALRISQPTAARKLRKFIPGYGKTGA